MPMNVNELSTWIKGKGNISYKKQTSELRILTLTVMTVTRKVKCGPLKDVLQLSFQECNVTTICIERQIVAREAR